MTMTNWMAHVGMAVVALSLSTPAAYAQTKTIKLGASVQLSGALANTGRYYRDAYSLAVRQDQRKGRRSPGR